MKFIPALQVGASRITPSSLLCLKMNKCSLEPLGTTYTSLLTSYSSKIHQRSYLRHFVRVGYRKGVLPRIRRKPCNMHQNMSSRYALTGGCCILRGKLYPKPNKMIREAISCNLFSSELHISRIESLFMALTSIHKWNLFKRRSYFLF